MPIKSQLNSNLDFSKSLNPVKALNMVIDGELKQYILKINSKDPIPYNINIKNISNLDEYRFVLSELEKIREFLTGTALTLVLDVVFSIIYIAVMMIYSIQLTFVALAVIPFFILLTFSISPIIRRQIREKNISNANLDFNSLLNVLSIGLNHLSS